MEHAINTIKPPKKGMEYNLLESVYAIIDSRIQYLEYQNNKLFKSYLRKGEQGSAEDMLPPNLGTESQFLLNDFEELLHHLAISSKSVKLLLLLRNYLLKDNADLILELLTNNNYLKLSEEKLSRLLDHRVLS